MSTTDYAQGEKCRNCDSTEDVGLVNEPDQWLCGTCDDLMMRANEELRDQIALEMYFDNKWKRES